MQPDDVGRRHAVDLPRAAHAPQGAAGRPHCPPPLHRPRRQFRRRRPRGALDRRRRAEEDALLQILEQEVALLVENASWIKLACLELLFVSATPNKEIADLLDLSQPQVASLKHEFVDKIKRHISYILY